MISDDFLFCEWLTGDWLTGGQLTSVQLNGGWMTGGLILPWVLKVPVKLPPGWVLPLAAGPCGVVVPSNELLSDASDTTFSSF